MKTIKNYNSCNTLSTYKLGDTRAFYINNSASSHLIRASSNDTAKYAKALDKLIKDNPSLLNNSGKYHKLIRVIGVVVEKYIKSIPGIGEYVIMPNHVHMILHISSADILHGPMWSSAPTNASVPSLIKTWKTLITKELGHSIWQRSYYDHVIRDERDYLMRVQYISENPAKWFYDDYFRW